MLIQAKKLILLSIAAMLDNRFIRCLILVAAIFLLVINYYCWRGEFRISYSIFLLGMSCLACCFAFIMWKTLAFKEQIKHNALKNVLRNIWPFLIAYVGKKITSPLHRKNSVICRTLTITFVIGIVYFLYKHTTENKEKEKS